MKQAQAAVQPIGKGTYTLIKAAGSRVVEGNYHTLRAYRARDVAYTAALLMGVSSGLATAQVYLRPLKGLPRAEELLRQVLAANEAERVAVA